jgi:hypothetical protein
LASSSRVDDENSLFFGSSISKLSTEAANAA